MAAKCWRASMNCRSASILRSLRCRPRQVTTAIIFASGFAEFGSDGTGEQERIAKIARAGGLALVGPNCLGFMNFADGFAAVFFSPQPIPRLPAGSKGAVAIVAQS